MKVKILIMLILCVLPFVILSINEDKVEINYNSQGQEIFVPRKYKRPKKNFMQMIGMEPVERGRRTMYKVKSSLKNLGTAFWMNFKEEKLLFPENPNDLEIETYFFYQSYLMGTDKGLPENWALPNTWEEFNNSNAPFLFVRKPGEQFTGSSTSAVLITKKGYQPYPDMHAVVFEDAHVETITEAEAEKYWEEALM